MISFADATGNLFNRLGKLGAIIGNLRDYQDTQETAMIDAVTGVVAQYNAEPDIQAQMGSAYIGLLNSAGLIGQTAQSIAAATINRVVYRDDPQLNQTLTSMNTSASIKEVIFQMKQQGASVLAMTVTATPSTIDGYGNATVVTSVRRPSDGLVLENAYAETLLITCTNDSLLGNSSEGNETLQLTGIGASGNVFNFDWPLGSNCNKQFNVINGDADNSQGNVLTNSGFEDWSNDVPNNWTIVSGTPGANIFREESIVYDPTDGGSALRVLGDGSTQLQLKQFFGTSTGTAGTLSPLSQYAINLFLRRDGTAAAAGTLRVDLVDENDVVIQDENGTNNTFNIDLTALTVFYAAYNGVFRTPIVVPDTYALRLTWTTPLTVDRSVYIDKIALGAMTQAYVSGPYVAVFGGSIPLRRGDFATVTVTNSRGAGGTLNTWQTLFVRLFPDMISQELLLPSSSVPTISDNLIG